MSALGVIPYVGDLAKLGKLGKYAKSLSKAIELAKNDAIIAKLIRPMLARIHDLIGKAPLDKLPASIAKPLRKMRDEIGGFLFPNCLPADTPVSAAGCLKAIQSVRPGDRVWSYDLVAGDWKLRHVIECYEHEYEGDLVTITANGEVIEATNRHPFWVVEGQRLEGRPRPEHVAEAPAQAGIPGRWVDAGDLQVGDVLLQKSGERAVVSQFVTRQVRQKVYNFHVEELQCYAVGNSRFLVHNNSGRTLNDPLPPHPKKPTHANPHAPDPEATGPHTVLGTRTDPKQSPAPYRQGITYDADGNPLGRTDVTTHGRGDHPNPHYHPYDPNTKNPFDPTNPGNFGPQGPIPN